MTRFSHFLATIVLIGLVTSPVLAKDPDPAAIQKMMAAMEKAGKVGPHHKHLQAMVGEWKCKAKAWMLPGAEPILFDGESSTRSILGGRYVQQTFESKMPEPFTGIGVTGYDNLRKQYTSTWIDSMSTAIYTSYGSVDKSGKVFTFQSKQIDPVSGKEVKTRDVIAIKDNNSFSMLSYKTNPGEKETKIMEIQYTRKK